MYFLAALAVIAAGCAKEAKTPAVEEFEETPEVVIEPSSVVFTAGIDTKAVLDGEDVKWAAGDAITIWNGTAAAKFTTTDSGATATFSTSGEFTETDDYTALYPADGTAAFSAGSVTTALPAAQTAVPGTFDPAANLAVASSTTTSLTFYNLVSYLKFTVPTGMNDLTSVSFKGNAGQKVAGAATVNVDTKALTATGSETATLSGTFAEGKTYYLAIAPQEFTAGYTVTITRTSGTYTMVSSKDVTFSRATARNIGDLWDGNVKITGTATASPIMMTYLESPSNVTNSDDVYTWRGYLSEGDITIKGAGTVASNIAIPSAGTYHVMYNKTTKRLRVYSQDVYVHLGNDAPMTGYPVTFTLNQVTTINNTTDVALNDYYGSSTGYSLQVSGISGGSFINKDSIMGSSGDKAANSPYVNDDYYPQYGWGRFGLFQNIVSTANSSDVVFTLSGLDSEGVYDVRVLGVYYKSSNNLRSGSFSIGSTEVIIDHGWDASSKIDLDILKQKLAVFDSVSPVGNSIALNVHSITKHRESNNDDFSHFVINFIYLSKVVYSQN